MNRNQSDNRKYERHQTNIEVKIQLDREDDEKQAPLNGVIKNMSRDGAFITVPDPLSIGTILLLQFKNEDSGETIVTKAVVRWNRKSGENPGMGIQFLNVANTKNQSAQAHNDRSFNQVNERP